MEKIIYLAEYGNTDLNNLLRERKDRLFTYISEDVFEKTKKRYIPFKKGTSVKQTIEAVKKELLNSQNYILLLVHKEDRERYLNSLRKEFCKEKEIYVFKEDMVWEGVVKNGGAYILDENMKLIFYGKWQLDKCVLLHHSKN